MLSGIFVLVGRPSRPPGGRALGGRTASRECPRESTRIAGELLLQVVLGVKYAAVHRFQCNRLYHDDG